MACELASVDELEEVLIHRDPEFVAFCKEFLINLKKVDQIIPFPRCWIPKEHDLVGFVTSLDGGKCGYGATIHAIAKKTGKDKESREERGDRTEGGWRDDRSQTSGPS